MKTAAFDFVTRTSCPACGSRAKTTRYQSPFDQPPIAGFIAEYYRVDPSVLSRGEYRLDQCKDCATIYQAEVGDNELLTALYVDWVFHIDRPEDDANYAYDMAQPTKSRDGHEIMAVAVHLGLRLRDLETLDYGMGWAGWGRVASALGCRSSGSDIAPDRMAFAEEHGVRAIRDEDIGKHRFHFINTEQAMEHLADPAGVTARLAGSLHPGGILKISVPSQGKTEALLARLRRGQNAITYEEVMPVQPLEHVNSFTIEGLTAMGKRFGLAPVRPSLADRFAFLTVTGGLDFRNPKRLAKELVRPWYQYRNPKNLYIWLQRNA